DDLDVGALGREGPVVVAADPAEAVDANADGHARLLGVPWVCRWRAADSAVGATRPYPSRAGPRPGPRSRGSPRLVTRRSRPSALQHLGGQVGLGAGDALVRGALVRHRQQPPDAAGDRVLGQRRVGELAELLEAGLAVLEPQLAGGREVVGDVVAEDLQR